MAAPASIDDYVAGFPADVAAILTEVRQRVHALVPEAGEAIRYRIPTITLDGRSLVHFAAWKKHLSVYPAPDGDAGYERAIAPYKGEKGTLSFPYAEPIPYDLIERSVLLLLERRTA